VIPATGPAREAPPGPVSAIQASRSNYQRNHEWDIKPQFRDTKDLRSGMGPSATCVGEPMRRGRLLLVGAFAIALLTLLGTVGDSLGGDRLLKSNTNTTRSHSLFRQGCMLYDLIPNMPEHRLAPLMTAFTQAISKADAFGDLLAYTQ
jgi:hypothetical protein